MMNWLYRRNLLFRYLSAHLWGRFFLLLSVLIVVLMTAHYLITLRFLLPGLVTPRLLFLLLPQLAMHAVPLSCCMSVGLVTQYLIQQKEDLFVYSFRRSIVSWWRAVGTFILGSTFLLFVLAGWLAPRWYRAAKKEAVASFSRIVTTIPPKKLVDLSPRLSVWYESHGTKNEWRQARFCMRQPNKTVLVIAAQSVRLGEKSFYLSQGSVVEHAQKRLVQHQFKAMQVPYDLYGAEKKATIRAKHATLTELWLQRKKAGMFAELMRRIMHILLLLLLPLLMMFGIGRLVRQQFLSVIIGAALLFVVHQVVSVIAAYVC